MFSCVLILPADLVDKGNALSEALGHGSPAYTVPMSATGQEPVTHWGLHTWASQSFLDLLAAGTMPEGLDYPQADFDAVMAGLIHSVAANHVWHFDAACREHGLKPVADLNEEITQ